MSDGYLYGPEWFEEARLSDGTRVEMRLVRPADKPLFRDGFARLSPTSRFRRFLSDKSALTEGDLRYLTEVDGVDHVALGAVALDEIGREVPVGIARFVRLPSRPEVAEPAVAVVDPMQRRGAGRLLLSRLVAAARERGVAGFRSELLLSNAPVRALLAPLDPVVWEERPEEGIAVCELALPPAVVPASADPFLAALHRILSLVAQGVLEVRRALDALVQRDAPPPDDEAPRD